MSNDGIFDTLEVTGNAQVDSLAVTNTANVGSLIAGSLKQVSIDPNSSENAVCLQAQQTLLPAPGSHVKEKKIFPIALQPEGGNVGIGTSTPGMPLHVSSADNQLLLLQSTKGGTGNTANLNFQTYSKAGNPPSPTATISAIDDGHYSSHIAFLTKRPGQDKNGQTEQMRIACDGKVGIGTLNPTEKLDIKGGVLLLRDENGHERFRVNSWSTDLIIQDANGKQVLVFDGTTNTLKLLGDIFLEGGDCAERFEIADDKKIDPGTVLVIGDHNKLYQCDKPYDKRVAGVVSGAENLKPGIILNQKPGINNELPVALSGKVYCKVDADYSPVGVGDLLTTSPTCGHAMKASDCEKAFGTVIGKALRGLEAGKGLIPILVALQ